MTDPLTTLAIIALAAVSLTMLLARLIPDEYDSLKPQPIAVKQPERR
jgi:hypothetical protein